LPVSVPYKSIFLISCLGGISCSSSGCASLSTWIRSYYSVSDRSYLLSKNILIYQTLWSNTINNKEKCQLYWLYNVWRKYSFHYSHTFYHLNNSFKVFEGDLSMHERHCWAVVYQFTHKCKYDKYNSNSVRFSQSMSVPKEWLLFLSM
jgi:hypothetical protein